MKIPKISLEQWAVFKAVVDEGSFAKAAEELNKSQSSISYIISNLQKQLPTPAMVIKGRKAVLTKAGETLYRHANNLLDNASNVEQIAAHLALGWETELTLAIDGVMHIEPVLEVIHLFSNQYPQTRIRILETVLSATDEAILEKKADIVLSPKILPGFLGTPITTIKMIAVAHPEHAIFSLTPPISEADLKLHRQIVIRDSGIKRQQDAGWLGAEQRLTVSHPDTSIKAVKAGIGFAFLPLAMLQSDLDNNRLKAIELTNHSYRKMPIYLINSKPDSLGPAAAKLSQLLLEELN
ncbi:LysR family transcriptional regulator [Catenovulum sp. 2E275]|uniref:LysR family transcriptional regulator n=1 Tax=Catenovulum sp. 2E275 TaxID=2980497 RepID=UPI0021D0368C|nr:LysR family transcriptional regulator [Catenovulum sp. 2E275]MCU4674892.1 LysR family transcriptional regulator [Catenovulum sp. 2E275]